MNIQNNFRSILLTFDKSPYFTTDDCYNILRNINLLALVTLLEYDELGIESRSGG